MKSATTEHSTTFDWAELAFASKKPIHALQAIFIAAPRDISLQRFLQIIKQYLPKANIILGVAKEEFVDGLDEQPHFRMLAPGAFQEVISTINAKSPTHKIYTLAYHQRELKHLISELEFTRILLINGSWKYAFHTTEAFYALAKKRLPHKYLAAFTGEAEARAYAAHMVSQLHERFAAPPGRYSAARMLTLAASTAKQSFDYNYQTGVTLGRKLSGGSYELLTAAFNTVVPYPTFALLHGAVREKHLSPPHDLNHYDTVHAETELILTAAREHISLKDTTLFINLLPCPSCARMLSETEITEFVYSVDHSEGYAITMLEAAGKKVRRIV